MQQPRTLSRFLVSYIIALTALMVVHVFGFLAEPGSASVFGHVVDTTGKAELNWPIVAIVYILFLFIGIRTYSTLKQGRAFNWPAYIALFFGFYAALVTKAQMLTLIVAFPHIFTPLNSMLVLVLLFATLLIALANLLSAKTTAWVAYCQGTLAETELGAEQLTDYQAVAAKRPITIKLYQAWLAYLFLSAFAWHLGELYLGQLGYGLFSVSFILFGFIYGIFFYGFWQKKIFLINWCVLFAYLYLVFGTVYLAALFYYGPKDLLAHYGAHQLIDVVLNYLACYFLLNKQARKWCRALAVLDTAKLIENEA